MSEPFHSLPLAELPEPVKRERLQSAALECLATVQQRVSAETNLGNVASKATGLLLEVLESYLLQLGFRRAPARVLPTAPGPVQPRPFL